MTRECLPPSPMNRITDRRQMPVKILPCSNFIVGGKNRMIRTTLDGTNDY